MEYACYDIILKGFKKQVMAGDKKAWLMTSEDNSPWSRAQEISITLLLC